MTRIARDILAAGFGTTGIQGVEPANFPRQHERGAVSSGDDDLSEKKAPSRFGDTRFTGRHGVGGCAGPARAVFQADFRPLPSSRLPQAALLKSRFTGVTCT